MASEEYEQARALAHSAGELAPPPYEGALDDLAYLKTYVTDLAVAYYGVSADIFDTPSVLSTSLLRDLVHMVALRSGTAQYYTDLQASGEAGVNFEFDVAAIFRYPSRGDCGLFAHQMLEVYRAFGFDATIANFINGPFGEYQSEGAYTDGHSTTEVFIPELGKYIAQDAMANAAIEMNGEFLSLYETRAALLNGETPVFDNFDVYYAYYLGNDALHDNLFSSISGIIFDWRISAATHDEYGGTRFMFPGYSWTDAHTLPPPPGATFLDSAQAAAALDQAKADGETWQGAAEVFRTGGKYVAGFEFVAPDGSVASRWLMLRLDDGSYVSIEFDTGEILIGSFDEIASEASGKLDGPNGGADLSDFLLPITVLSWDGRIRRDWVADDHPHPNQLDGTSGDDFLAGSADDDFIFGSSGNDVLWGGAGIDLLDGGAGDDAHYVDRAGDRVVEEAGGGFDRVFTSVSYALGATSEVEVLSTDNYASTAPINLTGNGFANELYGNAGNNVLIGGGGADLMYGFGGDDRYYVDDPGDRVVEEAGGGFDTVFTSVSYALKGNSHVEVLSTDNYASTAPINLTGNGFANALYGNAGNNVLIGGGGADLMYGFGGDDRYYVDDSGDRVVEEAGGGFDRVFTSVSYALGATSEVEVLSTDNYASTAPINLTGNGFANELYGNAGNNVLIGGGGADLMYGFGGDDRYYVDDPGDRVVEEAGGGFDTVFTSVSYALKGNSHVEVLSTDNYASTAPINLAGNGFANALYGNAGANWLDGLGGADTLFGQAGPDVFAFTTALSADNIDIIADFTPGEDTLFLGGAPFAALESGTLAAEAFGLGSAASTADQRIIYDPASGALWYDPDGTGDAPAVQFARLSPELALTHDCFLIG